MQCSTPHKSFKAIKSYEVFLDEERALRQELGTSSPGGVCQSTGGESSWGSGNITHPLALEPNSLGGRVGSEGFSCRFRGFWQLILE